MAPLEALARIAIFLPHPPMSNSCEPHWNTTLTAHPPITIAFCNKIPPQVVDMVLAAGVHEPRSRCRTSVSL